MPPLQTRPKAALVGVGRHVILRPAVQKRYLELEEPRSRSAVRSERVLAAMDDVEPRVPLDSAESGRNLRRSHWKVTAVLADDVLIDVEPGDTTDRRFAIAFDLGTTTVVATLLDLETGLPKAVQSILNSQQPFGADVISRISATMMDDGAMEMLQTRVHETLQQLAEEVCAEGEVAHTEVYEIVVAGNVTMIQLALGIDPEPLSMAPFTIAARKLPEALASDFGVKVHRRAPAVMFPALGAYVGPDIVAGVLATGITLDRRIRLFIDVGTNSEIVLGSSARVLATAAPAGPAFEAAQIRCGMRAAEGAIEGVKISDGKVELTVIGDVGRSASAAPGSSTRLRSSSAPESSTTRGASSRVVGAPAARSARRTSSISPTRCSCHSATSVSCSSPRRRSRPAGRSSAGPRASSPKRSHRSCWAARSARTSPGERRTDRPRAEAPCADRRRRQRRR